jgi:hypothetical protein
MYKSFFVYYQNEPLLPQPAEQNNEEINESKKYEM